MQCFKNLQRTFLGEIRIQNPLFSNVLERMFEEYSDKILEFQYRRFLINVLSLNI